MNPLYTAIVLGFTGISFLLIVLRVRFLKTLGTVLIISQILCMYDIFMRHPSQLVWLCNVTVFMNIFLLFKFHQRLFELFFCYAWVGCFPICLMPNNPYAAMIKDLPLIWMAYWIKHIIPLLMTLYVLIVQKKKLSPSSVYFGALGFFAYCIVIYFYNYLFNQNILYLNKPEPFMEPLGKYYVWIGFALGYFWVAALHVFSYFMGWVTKDQATDEEVN